MTEIDRFYAGDDGLWRFTLFRSSQKKRSHSDSDAAQVFIKDLLAFLPINHYTRG